jgi:hypothetical protein
MEGEVFVLTTLAFTEAIVLITARPSVGRGHIRKEDPNRMAFNGSAYVDSWSQGPTDDMVSSLRIGGIGSGSIGKELWVKVVARDGRRVLDVLSWKIDRQESPELRLAAPLPTFSIGAVLIAIE